MPKKLIQRLFPGLHKVREHPGLSVFGKLLRRENLWHINRRSVAAAFAVGLFCAFIPLPFQMLIAALVAILAQANMPISVLLVWVTNPLTIGPIFYLCYKTGQTVLGAPVGDFSHGTDLGWLMGELRSLLLGCLIIGSATSLAGYAVVRLVWRIFVIIQLQKKHDPVG